MSLVSEYRVPVTASLVLGIAIASPFWWALLVRAAPVPPFIGREASIDAIVAFWPAVLVFGGAAWGSAIAGTLSAGCWWSWCRGAIAGGLSVGVFSLAVALGPAHDLIAGAVPGALEQKFVLLLPALVGLVAAGAGVALGLGVGAPRLVVRAGLSAAFGAILPALIIVGGGYLVGVRVGSGGLAMPLLSAPALTASAAVGGVALARALRRARNRPHPLS
jgi:hypothetical protein